MQRKDLVCSLESAKTLKKLGVPQDSYFYYMVYNTTGDVSLLDGHKFDPHDCEYFAAFTVGELGKIIKNKGFYPPTWSQEKNQWFINGYLYHTTGKIWKGSSEWEWFESEVEARAKLLEYILSK